jgi:hypothetical protein
MHQSPAVISAPLTEQDLAELRRVFPELSWVTDADWQQVATHFDWDTWLDATASRLTIGEPDYAFRVQITLKLRANRRALRQDCRGFFGEANVPNINDPEDPTWA